MDDLNKKNFIYIKNILSKDEINLIGDAMSVFHKANIVNLYYHDDVQCGLGETKNYGDPLTDSLLLSKKDKIEKACGLKLLPTYSFYRVYNHYSELLKHTDRDSCEITVSITIKNDKDWPLFIGGDEVIIQPGDGALYFGAKVEHWRNEYEGDYAHQVFLHYVKEDGKYKDYLFDKRPTLGLDI